MSEYARNSRRTNDAVIEAEGKREHMSDKDVRKALAIRQTQEKMQMYDLLRRAADELKKVDRMMGFREGMAGYQRRVALVAEIEAMLPHWIPG